MVKGNEDTSKPIEVPYRANRRAQRRTANGKISGRAGGSRKAARAEGSLAVWGAKQWAYGRVGGERMQACVRAKLHILALANEFILHCTCRSDRGRPDDGSIDLVSPFDDG